MDYPLAGLKVLDFSRVLAGPFAGRLLSDLGAEVVKVEPPEGDVTRYWGKVAGGIPGYYHQQNAGKKDICIDMRAEGAVDLVCELVANADILIENYRPDVMDRLGIGYSVVSKVNPGLIMLSISGFGHIGPEIRRPAYAPVVHAEAGLIHRLAGRSGQPPFDLPLSVADTNASLHGLIGVLSAVIMRAKTGEGQHIDIAMLDATLSTDDQIQYDLEASHETGPLPNDIWPTPQGAVLLSTDFRLFWRLLSEQFNVKDPSNPEMALEQKISARREAAGAFMMSLDTREKLTSTMAKMNIPWGDVRDPNTIANQPTVVARGSIVEVDNRAGGTRSTVQSPYRFSNALSGIRGGAPHRGEHNASVLEAWLGKTPQQITDLSNRGILLADEDRTGT